MTSGHDVSEYLGTLGLVKSYFFRFFEKKKWKKSRKKKILVFQRPQRMRRFACLQDCLLTLTCHLSTSSLMWLIFSPRILGHQRLSGDLLYTYVKKEVYYTHTYLYLCFQTKFVNYTYIYFRFCPVSINTPRHIMCVFIFIRIKKGKGQGKEGVTLKLWWEQKAVLLAGMDHGS